jgi:CheY-like chemotaxis protein
MTTILVVDDEFLVADVLVFALEDEGYRVFRASNGSKALEILTREPADLVITDYMMPTMNGLELAETIRLQADGHAPPIILMSGAQAHIARRHGGLFAAVFDKPFKVADLVSCVRDIIGSTG